MSFTTFEIEFLKMGHLILQWHGKYPIPTHAEDQIEQVTLKYGLIRTTYLSLYARLSKEMLENCQLPGWKKYEFDS